MYSLYRYWVYQTYSHTYQWIFAIMDGDVVVRLMRAKELNSAYRGQDAVSNYTYGQDIDFH